MSNKIEITKRPSFIWRCPNCCEENQDETNPSECEEIWCERCGAYFLGDEFDGYLRVETL